MTREEVILKIREAQSAEELIALAKENNVEASEEKIRAYYESIHATGEIADEELNNVAGGKCYNWDGKLIVDPSDRPECFCCPDCRGGRNLNNSRGYQHKCSVTNRTLRANCRSCHYFRDDGFRNVCARASNRKK